MAINVLHRKIWKNQVRDALRYWIYIPALVILSGRAADMLFGLPALPRSGFATAAGVSLLAAGTALIWKSMRDLSVLGEGTANPLRPPKRLVTEGSYAVCRHPMFLGYDAAALGAVLLMRSPAMLFFSYPLFILWEVRFLLKEERILNMRFQGMFNNYKSQAGFLMPFLKTGGRKK